MSDQKYEGLGVIPDVKIAEKYGVNTETIRRARLDAGQSASRQYAVWTPEMIDLLGTDDDQTIAHKLGLTRAAVQYKRRRMRIEAKYPRPQYMTDNATDGVVALTAHVSQEVRKKAARCAEWMLQEYKGAGLPMRKVSTWQAIEIAINRLHNHLEEKYENQTPPK